MCPLQFLCYCDGVKEQFIFVVDIGLMSSLKYVCSFYGHNINKSLRVAPCHRLLLIDNQSCIWNLVELRRRRKYGLLGLSKIMY